MLETVRRLLPARAAHADDGAGAVQRVRHGDEVVLAAGAADDAAVLELVGGDGAEQGRHHGRVDETGVAALRALAGLVAVERVGEGDAGHGDLGQLLARHLAQLAIEGLVADEEARVQDGLAAVGARDAAAQDAGAHQRQEAVDQHLRAAVEAGRERARARASAGSGAPSLSSSARNSRVAGVAQDQRMRQRVGERADADLQRAAVLDRASPHAAPWRSRRATPAPWAARTDRSAGAPASSTTSNSLELDLGLARHVGQVGVDLDGERQRPPGRLRRRDVGPHVERDVGVGAEADARLALAGAAPPAARRHWCRCAARCAATCE